MGGRFVVEREVGRGAVGVVYRAYDLTTEQNVALKIIASESGMAPVEEARLMQEGQILSDLDHPGIVKIVAYGVLPDSMLPFVAMEWLEGEDLAARQQRAPLDLPQILELGVLVAAGLSAAHSAGVIHRDVKPGNIFLCRSAAEPTSYLDALPKLVDFGVATGANSSLEDVSNIAGTPAYMAPEQASGNSPIDERCDIYSLGATLFELIAGRPPARRAVSCCDAGTLGHYPSTQPAGATAGRPTAIGRACPANARNNSG